MSFLNAEVHKENLIGKILERLRHEWQELGGEISFYERRGEGYIRGYPNPPPSSSYWTKESLLLEE